MQKCQMCGNKDATIDGKSKFGSWAFMCDGCHEVFGCGLGVGRGQQLPLSPAQQVAKQARSFCYQFTEGAISLSEFLFAAIALEAANRDLVNRLHHEPESEWGL